MKSLHMWYLAGLAATVAADWSGSSGNGALTSTGTVKGPADFNSSFVFAVPYVNNPQTADTPFSIAYEAGVVLYTDMLPDGASAPFAIYGVDAHTGSSKWNTTLPSVVSNELDWDMLLCGSPSVAVVIMATAAKPACHFFGVNPVNGAIVWEVDYPSQMFNNYQCSGSSFVAWMHDGTVAITNVTTGKQIKNFTFAGSDLFPESMMLVNTNPAGSAEPTLAVTSSKKGIIAIDLVNERLAWSALQFDLVTALTSSPDGVYVAAFVGPTLVVDGEGIYVFNASSGANVTMLAYPQSQGTDPGPNGVATNYNDKMALAWSPLPNGPGQHGTLFYSGMMGNFIPVDAGIYWYGQILAWEMGEAKNGGNASKLVGNLDLSVNANYTKDPDGYMEGPLVLGDMSVDATGDVIYLSYLPAGYTWTPGKTDDDPIVDTTRTTFARAVLDRSAQTITLQSTFAYILNGDDNSQFALGPSDGQLIVANGTHLVKFASN